ncbi:MAG: DJ-1/PfpI family protein [Ruminococcus flavefaciens]|nr:DJ-1/PfpI family protein [Ruminococcus flavefaciens]MCM1363266.1 DJ-1/PfpI family protein [Clostridiales bacterium]
MNKNLLKGKRVAVLVETEYIPSEIKFYCNFFSELGAEVDLMTYLWGKEERIIVSDVTEPDGQVEQLTVTKEIADANPNDYAIVLTAANYVACRLREIPPMGSLANASLVRSPAAVRFMASAMMNPQIVKGALCHALWILTPVPELLNGRKVICHTVVLADVLNAGAVYVPDESHVVVDRDLVTGRSATDIEAYCQKLAETYESISTNPINKGELL